MDFKQFITMRNNNVWSETDFDYFVNGIISDEITDKNIIEFANEISKNDISDEEIVSLCRKLAASGKMLNLKASGQYFVDQHSAGNYTDGSVILLMGLLSALDIKFARVLSGKYSVNNNTLLNKLNTIKGFNAVNEYDIKPRLEQCNVALIEDKEQVAPAAARIFNVCKKHNKLNEIIRVISVLSTKIATGANMLIVDVKNGEGSAEGINDCNLFAQKLVKLGNLAGLTTVAIISDNNWPTMASIGNYLEITEVLQTLSMAKDYIGSSLLKLSTEMAVCVLMSSKKAKTRSEATLMVKNIIENKQAYKHFINIIKCYGGDVSQFEEISLKDTAVSYIIADFGGYIGDIVMDNLYKSAEQLIGSSNIDENAGIVLLCGEGDKVEMGQKLAKVYFSHNNKRFFKVSNQLFKCFDIVNVKPIINNLFYKVEV